MSKQKYYEAGVVLEKYFRVGVFAKDEEDARSMIEDWLDDEADEASIEFENDEFYIFSGPEEEYGDRGTVSLINMPDDDDTNMEEDVE